MRQYWPEEFRKFVKLFEDEKEVSLMMVCEKDPPRCKSSKVVGAEELKVHKARFEVKKSAKKSKAGEKGNQKAKAVKTARKPKKKAFEEKVYR